MACKIEAFQSRIFKQLQRPLIALVLFSIIVRLALWLGIPKAGGGGFSAGPTDLYVSALTEHFWDYILFAHTKPPLTYFVHSLLLRVFGQSCFTGNLTLLPAFLFDAAAVGLVYSVSLMLGVRRSVAWLVTCLWSVELITFEFWRSGGHQDHYTIVLVAFFAWALCKRLNCAKPRYDILTSIAGGLLIAQSTVTIVVVPCVLGLSILLSLNRAFAFKRGLIIFCFPLLISFILIAKNAHTVGVFNTSSVGGQNMMQVYYTSNYTSNKRQGFAKLYKEAKRINLPKWWLWCFQRAEQMHEGWVGPLYGACFWDSEGYNFEPLYQELVREKEWELAKIVQSDIKTWSERPWLFSGPVNESVTRFAARYGKESKKLWAAFIMHKPYDFLARVIRTHGRFFIKGPLFFLSDTYEKQVKAKYKYPFKGLVDLAALVLAPMLYASALLSYLLFLQVPFLKVMGYWPRAKEMIAKRFQHQVVSWPIMNLLGFATILTAFLFCISSCCENDRFFVQVTPYLIPISAYILDRLLETISWVRGENSLFSIGIK